MSEEKFTTDMYRLDGKKLHEYPLPVRLRVMANLMHTGAAWGFSAEATWLEEAADLLEKTAKD